MADWTHNYSGRLHRAACLIDTASGRKQLTQRQAGYSTPLRLVVALQASDKQLADIWHSLANCIHELWQQLVTELRKQHLQQESEPTPTI